MSVTRLIAPNRGDEYNITYRGDPPIFVINRGQRWQSLRSHLFTLLDGSGENEYVVVTTKTRQDALLAKQAAYTWMSAVKANKAIKSHIHENGDGYEVWFYNPKVTTPQYA